MRIAVVGGGLAGLTAARALVAAGIDVQVFEASARPGGVIETTQVDGFVREHAASSFLGGPARGALALCKELGVPVVPASPRARRRWIYIDGKLRALPRNPIELVRSDLLTWRGKLDLLREPFRGGRDPAEAGDESMHAFAARRLGAEAARAIVAPFVTGVFAADAHDITSPRGFHDSPRSRPCAWSAEWRVRPRAACSPARSAGPGKKPAGRCAPRAGSAR